MTYEEKKAVADAYLEKRCGLFWNDLPDINSLHDCDSQEDIFSACDARLEDSGFPMDLDDEIEEKITEEYIKDTDENGFFNEGRDSDEIKDNDELNNI